MIYGRLNQSHWQLIFPISAVETEHAFIDVLLQIFVRHTMNIAANELFEVVEHQLPKHKKIAKHCAAIFNEQIPTKADMLSGISP